jgi:lipoate-protein ligase B
MAGCWPNTLVLLEHEPVLTLGQTTKDSHWKEQSDMINKQGIQIITSERGGSVTFHGPGQIVGYPILLLRDFCSGPKTYMRMLEDVIIAVLEEWGMKGRRIEKMIGVWIEDSQNPDRSLAKIAAFGVRISRGITTHGFSLNVNVDLQPFDLIIPCGIENCRVTSMAEVLGRELDLSLIREQVAHHFSRVFGIKWTNRITEVVDLPLSQPG